MAATTAISTTNASFSIITTLTDRIGSLALEAWNVKEDVEKLTTNLNEIESVILDADKRQKTTNSYELNNWIETLKEALHEAEDFFDEVSTGNLTRRIMAKHKSAKNVRIFFSKSNQIMFNFRMASKIKKMRKMFDNINVRRKVFNFSTHTSNQPAINQRDTYTFISEECVVGREDVKKEVLRLVLNTGNEEEIVNDEDNISVISIVGIGGLGKTALAQLVFYDPKIKDHFQFTEWVCVADNISGFHDKVIAANIANCDINYNRKQVFEELNQKIQGKRCLVVLDDVWNERRESWYQFKSFLVNIGKGSKIIITTRSQEVAKVTGACPSSTFFLEGLNENQSWSLFCRHAFGGVGNEIENQNLVSIGKHIVKKCAGVPFAIRVIGALMRNMNTEEDWFNIKNRDLLNIDEQSQNVIFQLLKLSYDHLPLHLRKCFAFCSLFQKGYEIDKRTMIRLWIAQGFIQKSSDESKSLEDDAEECFMTLLHRSFFQTMERNIHTFKVHDLMHDLACLISNKEYVMIDPQQSREPKIEKVTRHISYPEKACLWKGAWHAPGPLRVANKLRTYLLPSICPCQSCHKFYDNPYSHEVNKMTCKLIMSSFKKLRALTLRSLTTRKLPSCIGKLKYLRYLDISYGRSITFLPKSITELCNLETLILDGCVGLREWPKDMWKMISLRHLEFRDCVNLTTMPLGIGELRDLQTVTIFYCDRPSELEYLNNLGKELTLSGMDYFRRTPIEVDMMNLWEKEHLEHLTLIWTPHDVTDVGFEKDDLILQYINLHPNAKKLAIRGYGGVEISSSVDLFSNLNKLSLSHCPRLQYLPLSILKVRCLCLDHLPCLEWIVNHNSDCSSSTFSPSLVEITLSYLPNLKGWCGCTQETIGRGHSCYLFERLDHLDIIECKNFISIPQDTKIKKIRKLSLTMVGEEIVEEVLSHSVVDILEISNSKDLKSLSRVLPNLNTLAELHLSQCYLFDPCNDEYGCYSMQWKELKNLKVLKFDGIPTMEHLPDGLEHVTTLQRLIIQGCDKFNYVPEWAKSLQELIITNCQCLPGVLTHHSL